MSQGGDKKQGTIKKIVSDRGFGFISGDRGDVFFHFSSMGEGEFDELHEGQAVEYEVEEDGGSGRGGKGRDVRQTPLTGHLPPRWYRCSEVAARRFPESCWSTGPVSSQMQPAGNVSEGGTVGRVGFVCALLAAAIFALDVKIPLGVAGGAPYAAVVLICLWSPGRRDAIVAAAACSVLTLLSYHLWPPGGDGWQVLINRIVALLAIWVTALLVTRRKLELHEHDRRLREQIDALVELTLSKTLGQGDLSAALREITESATRVLRTQRVGVWLFSEDRSRLRCVEQYERDRNRHSSGAALEAKKYPAYFATLETERTVSVVNAVSDPRTCEFRASYLEPNGIASLLDAPIRLRGQTVGVVCHEHVGTPRRWTVEEQNFAGSVADFVDLAIEASDRKRAEDDLREHHDHLEELVEQRTTELKRVNARLVDEINDHKQAVEALEASEERYRDLFENSGELIQCVAIDGSFIYVNPAWKKTLGYSDDEVAQLTLSDIVHSDSREHCEDVFRRIIAGETMDHVEAKFVTRDGQAVVVAGSSSCRFENGLPVATRGTFHNITQEKREAALKESEERYRLLIQDLPVGVYRNTPGPKGEFLMANPAHARMMGYDSVEEFLKTSVADRYPNPHDRKVFSDKISAEGNVVEEELQLKRRDGSILWAAVTAQVVRNAAGVVTHIDGIIENITERKEIEEKLAWHARELARSNAELERFAYAVSHDLQEPLRAVAGHCKLLQRRCQGKLDRDANELIAHAVDGTTRMKALIDGLLAYSRVGVRSVTLGTTDCEEVVDAALANLRTAIDDASATVRRDRLPTVMADSMQLVALFQNLISNAVKYRSEKSPAIHIGADRRHGKWVFCVRDNGIGIEPAYRDRVFAIFQRLQTYDECPGTGIGLAICKKIVEGFGGRIWVESEPGQGSSFFFTLPADTAQQ